MRLHSMQYAQLWASETWHLEHMRTLWLIRPPSVGLKNVGAFLWHA